MREPAAGPYIGQAPMPRAPCRCRPANVERFASLLEARGIDAGHGGRVTTENPMTAFFGRIDVSIPEWRSRLAVRHTYSDVEQTTFARSSARTSSRCRATRSLSSSRSGRARLQLFTQPAARRVQRALDRVLADPESGAAHYAYAPTIQVCGTERRPVHGHQLGGWDRRIGSGHRITNESLGARRQPELPGQRAAHGSAIGARAEWLRYYGATVPGSFGRWTFSSLDSLERGVAINYRRGQGLRRCVARALAWRPGRCVHQRRVARHRTA